MNICYTEENFKIISARYVDDDYIPNANENLAETGFAEIIINAIKSEAQRRVIVISGVSNFDIKDSQVWVPKQLNPIAAFCLLLYKMQKGVATAEDEAKALALLNVWGKVNAVRIHSDLLEKKFLVNKEEINILEDWPE